MDIEYYIYYYKHTTLQTAFKDYLNKKISYDDYYNTIKIILT